LTPLYWRTGDFKKSLLEIGMNENTGAICKVTVPLIGNCSTTESEDFLDATRVKSSLPLCDISDWPKERFKDEPFTFATLVGKDSVLIWLTPTVPVKTIYEIGQVHFGADGEGNLRLLQFKILSRVNLDHVTDQSYRRVTWSQNNFKQNLAVRNRDQLH
jgi:hypothetical protein